MTNEAHYNSIDPKEQEKFEAWAMQWWDADGPMRPLHLLNPVRLDYLRDQLIKQFELSKPSEPFKPLSNLTILDVGCGAGLVSEPMARMGANVTGIDAGEKMVNAAKLHAEQSPEPLTNLSYAVNTVEALAEQKQQFDVVFALEVVEHVESPDQFIACLSKLVRPEGVLILSTLNRTLKGFLLGIIGAEYVLRWLPRGTHDWNRFLKPSEITRMAAEHGFHPLDLDGIVFDPLRGRFKIHPRDVAVNYIMSLRKLG